MTERDLEKLKRLAVPPPRGNSRQAALDAAMTAFEASLSAASGSGDAELAQSTNKEPTQGNVIPLRQTETSDRQRRSFRMQLTSRRTQALAASIAALVIAAPIAFQQFQPKLDPSFTRVASEQKPAAGINGDTPHPLPQIAVDAPKPALKMAVGEVPKSEVSAPTSSQPPQTSPEASGKSARERPMPQDLVGQSTLGRTASDPRDQSKSPDFVALDAARARTDSNLRRAPNEPSPAAPPAANEPMPEPQKVDGTIRGMSAVAGDPGVDSGQHQTALPAGAGFTNRPMASHVGASDSAAVQTSPLSKHAIEAVAATTPAQPAKPDLSWMGRAEDERMPSAGLQEQNRDKFETRAINPVKQVASEPVSTFSIDVDTASYAFARRALNNGHLPPQDAVRIEEMINYFPYAYPAPESVDVPFKPTVTVMPSPWNTRNQLVHVAIKGYDLKSAERPHANIVLLMDVSGSMAPSDRLPLVKNAFRMLVNQLRSDDTVAIVTYASGSGIALEPTRVENKSKILRAIDELGAGGSTAGAAGIADAYRLAEENFDKNGVNRIILATDGDFNVGVTDQNELKSMIERKRQSGIYLSILGVGQGNHNDALMQTLAQNGNGTAAYADTLSEARKVLVEEASSTLFTIAKDVKAQIEWNPARVSEYRLIGYETRALNREDFNNDRVDAGDIGSGHTVTAIYEVTPVGAPPSMDELRYAKSSTETEKRAAPTSAAANAELGFLKLRYKRPNENTSQLISLPIEPGAFPPDVALPKVISSDVRFSVAVAAFGQMLKGEPYTQGYSYDDVLALASGARGEDPLGYRAEFLNLVRLAKSAQP